MTVKSVLHTLANEMNRPHWHDEIDEEDPDTVAEQDARYDERYQGKAQARTDNDGPRQVDSDDENAVEFQGTAKPASLGGGSSKDGDTTNGNG
jgi:hypothetical protein